MRTRICFWTLLLVPLLAYMPGVIHPYANREDYEGLRLVREEPGRLVRVAAAQGRPLYGALMETAYTHADTVPHLVWLRFASLILVTVTGLMLWRQVDAAGWPEIDGAALGLGVALLPASQVAVSSASGWPMALSTVLALGGFAALELELEKGGLKRTVGMFGGGFIYVMSALVHPANTLFALVPLAALSLTKERRSREELLRWMGLHVLVLAASLVVYFGLLHLFVAAGMYPVEAADPKTEPGLLARFVGVFWHSLPNALALVPLRDDHLTGAVYYWPAVIAVPALLAWIVRGDKVREDSKARLAWTVCLGVLPAITLLLTLTASAPAFGYRTLAPLSGLVLTGLVVGLRRMPLPEPHEQWAHFGGLGAYLFIAALVASYNTNALVAVPLGREWELVHDGVDQIRLKDTNKIFVIPAARDDRSTDRIYRDEFGAVASVAESAPRDMFTAALHDRFPEGLPPQFSIAVGEGPRPPTAGAYDVVIDLRRLRHWRER